MDMFDMPHEANQKTRYPVLVTHYKYSPLDQ